MKLNQLRDLVAIAERGSLRAAARHLGVAQSSLTRSIGELERELGTPLFEREVRGMVLTPRGRVFYQRASLIVNELRRARETLEQSQGGLQGTVTVGLSIMPHMGMLPGALPLFRQRFPDVVLKLIEGLYPDLEPGLRDGNLDFYLGASPNGAVAPGLAVEPLLENTRVIVCRKGHPLAHASSIEQLIHAEWLTPSLTANATEDLNALFASLNLPAPRIKLQAHSAMTVLVALASTDLLGMLPAQTDGFALAGEELHIIRVRETLPAPSIVLVRRADLPLTPSAEHFCDLLRRYAPSAGAPAPAA